MKDYTYGLICGFLAGLFVCGMCQVFKLAAERDCKDRFVLEYYSEKNYDRKLFLDLVNGSDIQDKFLNKEYSYGKNSIRYVLTNPR